MVTISAGGQQHRSIRDQSRMSEALRHFAASNQRPVASPHPHFAPLAQDLIKGLRTGKKRPYIGLQYPYFV